MANAHDCRSFFSFLGMMCHWRVLFLGVIIQCRAFNTMAQTIVNTETLLLDADSSVVWTGVAGDHSSANVNVMDFSADAGCMEAWRVDDKAWHGRRWHKGARPFSPVRSVRFVFRQAILQSWRHLCLRRRPATMCCFLSSEIWSDWGPNEGLSTGQHFGWKPHSGLFQRGRGTRRRRKPHQS